MNATQTEAKFRRRIEREFRRVRSRCLYIDTVQATVPRLLSSAELSVLSAINAPGKVIIGKSKRPKWSYVRLHQPSRGSINYLSYLFPTHTVSRVDVALDLMVDRQWGALRIQVFLRRHLRQLWHGKRRASVQQNTVYFGRAWNRRNIAMYASKTSKITGLPCAHVELRFYSAAACKRIGVATLLEIARMDVVTLVQRNCRLATVIPSRVEARLRKAAALATLMHNRKSSRPTTVQRMEAFIGRMLSRLLDTGPRKLLTAPIQLWFEWKPTYVTDAVVEAPPDSLVNRHNCPFLF